MKPANRIIILILLLLLPSVKSTADIPQQPFRFRHFNASSGLTSNSVSSICVDKRGCIWAGTGHGIFRCCSNYFTLIEIPSDKGFNITDVNYMIIDKNNRLWIAANSGLFIYDIEYQDFSRIDLTTNEGSHVTATVNTLAEDEDGNIWISTYGEGVLKYDTQTGQIKKYTFEVTGNAVDKVFVDSDNIVWATVRNIGNVLARLNKSSDKFEFLPLKYDNPEENDYILTIFEDSSKTLWLGTWTKGIQKLNKYSGHIKTYLNQPNVPVLHIHSIAEYQPGKLFVGSDDGLLLYDISSDKYELYIPDNSNPTSISDKFIYPITKDKEGGFWIGSYYGGISYISPFDDLFYGNSCSLFTNSKSGNIVSCMCEASNGDIWLGTDDKGLIRFTPSDGSYRHFMPHPGENSISFYNIHALCFDNDNLWIGTYSGGLNIYNTKTGRFKSYGRDHYGGLGNMSVYSIFKDRDGTIWLGTMAGVEQYNRETDQFTQVKYIGGVIIDICQDNRSGSVWFATQTNGLQCYNPDTKEWKEYIPQRAEESPFDRCVNSVYIDEDNTLWAGTSQGLYRYNPDKDMMEYVYTRSNRDDICCITGDYHILWLSTSNGIFRFDPASGSCITYNQADGLQSDHFLPASGIKTKDGKIYFGSTNGFNSFSPYKIKINTTIPHVILTDLSINNQDIAVGENSVLKKSPDYLNRIDLGYNQNNIIFHYSALSYYSPEKINYAYRLVGFDDDWNYVSNLKTATYTNLSPGTYDFQVKSSNSSGTWDNNYKSIQLVIHPPFWFSTLFLVLYVIIVILLLIWIIFIFVRRTERKNRQKMDMLNQQREKEIYDEKIRFFTSIAHEIRTPLSLITGPIERILTKDDHYKENIEEDLHTVNRNSQRLLSLVNQLLDFRKIEQDSQLNLFFVLRNMPVLINSVVKTYLPYFVQYEVELNVSQLDEFEAEVDPEAIAKVLSNLLTNAAKYSRGKVELKCIVNEKEQNFRIIVTDNGEGIAQNELDNVFKPFYCIANEKNGTGIGLSIVKSLVSAQNGTITIDSVIGKGCSFIITLPLKQSNGESADEAENTPDDILAPTALRSDTENKYSLLIVEDNKDMMAFLYDILSDNYSVLTAKNGADALEVLKTNNISIIVCDWLMPVMDGAELCKAIRKNIYISHIPFLMLTAKTDMKAKIEGMEAGVDIFIEKPFSVQYLCACIKSLLDMRKAIMEKFSKTPLIPLTGIAPNPSNEEFLSHISDIIEENISNADLSVDFIVKQMHVSRSGFFAKIKMLADVTPNDLIQIIRLKKAAALMLQNRYLVNEICYMVGFRNPSYFSKCFHKQFGVTPIDFIKSHNKSSGDNSQTKKE